MPGAAEAVAGIIQGAAGIAGTAVAGSQAKKARELEQRYRNQALQQFGDIDLPTLLRLQYEMQGPSGYENISEDPRLKAAQMQALNQLQEIGAEGGMTPADKAQLQLFNQQQAQQARGAQDAIRARMAAMGQMGSGASLGMQLAAQQNQAQNQSAFGAQAAIAAQQRALQAMQGAGQLGGQVRGQDWQQQAERARAMDAINRFNVANRNQQQYYNRAVLPQSQFGNQMQLAGARSNALTGAAQSAGSSADSSRQMMGGFMGVAGQGLQNAASGFSQYGDTRNQQGY